MVKKKIFDRDALLAEYKTLTMRADKRLQRLEKYMQRPGYETLAKGAYKRAMRDIGVWSGKGHKRFGTKAPEDNRELQAKINDIKSFLRADTSTMRPGIDTQGFAGFLFLGSGNFRATFNFCNKKRPHPRRGVRSNGYG